MSSFAGQSGYELKIERLMIDPAQGRRDPACELAGSGHRFHQGSDESAIDWTWYPLGLALIPFLFRDHLSIGSHADLGELAD